MLFGVFADANHPGCPEPVRVIYDFHLDPEAGSIYDCSQPDWRKSLGEGAVTALEECLAAFELTKKARLIESGVRVLGSDGPEAVRYRKMIPRTLQAEADGANVPSVYHVCFETGDDSVNHTFRVRADDLDAIEIDWDEQYWINIDGELSVARPLFEAIAAFYKFGVHLKTR